jgi:uncharacterized membrane protein
LKEEENAQVPEVSALSGESQNGVGPPAYVIDDEIDRFIKAEIPEVEEPQEKHGLNGVVHSLLMGGLALSTTFIILGLLLSGIYHRELPSASSGLQRMFQDIKAGAPSGFLNLGILFLIATPILRVLGSLVAFISGRDWRFAAITSIVLLILAISVLVGRG